MVASALIATACGGTGNRSEKARSPAVVLMARAPNSLDPAVGDTPEALEADWLAYTPLLTYVHDSGARGTQLIPGLAQTLPSISGGGRTYTFTLIKGLRYSDGEPVRASDFTRAVERAIKLWPEARRLINGHIVGAGAFAAGRATTISGIDTDDLSGRITIQLTSPDGAFENVLALPALAPVPAKTPFTNQQAAPPPGLGPYRIADVVPGRSFSLIRTPNWQKEVTDVPPGHLDIAVRITGDASGNARAVLDNAADLFDSFDAIPAGLAGQIAQRASDRYARQTMGATSLIFMNVHRKPFSSQLAREAVRAGLDQVTVAKLDQGLLRTGCYLLPPTLFGHPEAPCPDGDDAGAGNLTRARALVKQSGMAGAAVVVSTQAGSPVREWMAYYTSLLDQIGFRARLADGPGAGDAQTGYDALDQPVPNPAYVYDQLAGGTSPGKIDDPYINTAVNVLAAVPGSTVSGVASFWRRLELYVANRAYVAVLGYPTVPEFVSSRIDFDAVVFSPLAGVDWSSLRPR